MEPDFDVLDDGYVADAFDLTGRSR